MKPTFSVSIVFASALVFSAMAADVAAAKPSLLEAKKEAGANGYIFETSHGEIVAKAKKEGQLRVLTTMDSDLTEAMIKAFNEKYPSIKVSFADLGSVQDAQRYLLELKAGRGADWDVARLYTEFYEDYLPFQKKFDILGMAKGEVLNVPAELIDPKSRNVVTMSSNMNVVAYNKSLIAENKVPDRWQDFLKPEFKGRKFAADIRPVPLAVLVPAWGLEKVLGFAKQIAAQDPIWVRGHTRNLTAVLVGEYPLFLGPNFGASKRVQGRDPKKVLGIKILEPVPVRLHEAYGVLQTAKNPYAGLLWLEFEATPKGQKIMDQYWPFGASVFSPGSAQEELTKGKKLSVVDWNHYKKLDEHVEKIVAAYGFPQVQKK
ncbi:MAG: ABC transporter substrate-binding protein [Candidatus Binatia bacterium]